MGLRLNLVDLNEMREEIRAIGGALNRFRVYLESAKASGNLNKEEFKAKKKDFSKFAIELEYIKSMVDELAFEAEGVFDTHKKVEELVRELENKGKKDQEFCTEWEDAPKKGKEE